ncbi:LysR family transcriptional regulator [Thalassococcus sp. S3]|uniref:LysR family transcriptional regulator n=1 Tax=Thalassococcus sp. S3 TaxID=2017482 RepID=UPI00102435B1|nr:LysR family transcriptional regulator [Thalassococcus sp. S3]QBF30376.1 hypothetical protein CFI11_03980 [Thalassococcus sp. S3]
MKFTLKQLRYFDAALRTGSIARAAEEMHISQSSITAALDLIEQSLGADLFRRIPAKGIVATRMGTEVGARVAGFLEQARVFESDLMSLAGDPTGTLRLACYAPTAPYVLPPILKRLAQYYPDIRIDLMEGDMAQISERLTNGTVDVALTYGTLTPQSQPFHPLFGAYPWVLLPSDWPEAQRASVDLRDIADRPMVLLDLPGTEPYFRSLFEAQGLRPNVVHSTKSSSVLRGLVAGQFGYSILNICGPNDRDGRTGYTARPMAGDPEAPAFGVAYAAPLKQSAMVQAMLSIGQNLTAEGGFDHLLMGPDR